MEIVFWCSVLLVVSVYGGYPLLLAIWSRLRPRPVGKQAPADNRWPSVSIVIAAHNEGRRIPHRVRNLLDQDYPGSMEILVVSDGSTDGTRTLLAQLPANVRLLELPRGGKAQALNAGVAAASGEIIVFADARQRFASDAVRHLVANFSDPAVGAVTGELVLDCESTGVATDSTIGEGVGLYWRYEKWLRRNESRVWSTLGATGAIYAMRRELWEPLPPETLLDDVLAPMRVVLAHRRVVFDDRARAFDRAADSATESRRKTRTLAGNYQILAQEPRLLLPFVNPVWVQYVCHKVGRLLVPWALLFILLSSAVLAFRHDIYYAVALILQLMFYGLAAIGGWIEFRERRATRSDELPGALQRNA